MSTFEIVVLVIGVAMVFQWLHTRLKRSWGAQNVVYATYAYRLLPESAKDGVDDRTNQLCARAGLDPMKPTTPVPGHEKSAFGGPAAIYGMRALAMRELGIPPPQDIGPPKWYMIDNPITIAITATKEIERFRQKVKDQLNIDLNELDDSGCLPENFSSR